MTKQTFRSIVATLTPTQVKAVRHAMRQMLRNPDEDFVSFGGFRPSTAGCLVRAGLVEFSHHVGPVGESQAAYRWMGPAVKAD